MMPLSAQLQALLTSFCKTELPSSSSICLQAGILPLGNYPTGGPS